MQPPPNYPPVLIEDNPRPFPPPYPYRRRRSNWRGRLMGCCFGIIIFSLLTCLFFTGLLGVYVVAPPPTTNILVIGSDARPDSAEDEAIARTDSIMIVSLNPREKEVSLFSVPRDLFIESPTYGYLRVNTIVRNAELNAPNTGMDELMASLEYTFGMEIDHYMRVDFNAFVDTVDALGGIKVDVPKHIVDNAYPTADYGTMRIEFFEGEQTLDGENALIYARTRHGDDDYQRAQRQQQVIEAVLNKLTNPLHWYRLPAATQAVLSNLETDMNLGQMIFYSPSVLLYGNSQADMEQFVIDRDYILYGADGEAYPNVDQIQPWIEAHMR